MGECSERIQSKLLHFKGGERPLVKEFPLEKEIGVKLYKGLWVNIPPHLSVIVLPYFVGRPRLDRQEGRLKVSQVPVTEWFHLDLHVLTFRTCSITPLSGGFLD